VHFPEFLQSHMRRLYAFVVTCLCFASMHAAQAASDNIDKEQVKSTMRRATAFMVDKVAYRGGYLWNYLPDFSRRWGEMEARETMIWLQPPGTSSMGHIFLDAYHATGDAYYYEAAEQVGAALMWGQHPSGGWNYVVDFAGDRSLREWYDTVGRNAWRLEEFQHYYGNATFDDQVTSDAATFLLRLYMEKLDPRYKPAVDRALQFVLDSQYPLGGWPQRYPLRYEHSKGDRPDYTHYPTFNDDVAWENVSFLIQCYQVLGDPRLLDAITRGMNFFLLTQQGQPNPGWALQYTTDLKPTAARTYEPLSLSTITTSDNIEHMIDFYRFTGDTRFLARIPEALDWLDRLRLRKTSPSGYTHPEFIELQTNRPLFIHRRGSNVVNGEYYVDYDEKQPLGHYSPYRTLDVPGLRKAYEAAMREDRPAMLKRSPLAAGKGVVELPRYFATRYSRPVSGDVREQARTSLGSLNEQGYWPAQLSQTSHPYRGPGSKTPASGDFASTYVGDESDTSPFAAPPGTTAISTAEYIRNMNVLIQALQ
jgi:PelA/Pel-15E family pectate lyase